MRKNKRLPAVVDAKSAPPEPVNPVRRILVVDDDPFFCHRNAEVLIRHGYEVNATENGTAGWEELQANHYHLLITENEMPSLTGLELVKKLRAAHMALPVIMATVKLPPVQVARHYRLHPIVTLLKPYTLTEFMDAVKVVLNASNEAGEIMSPPNWQGYAPANGVQT